MRRHAGALTLVMGVPPIGYDPREAERKVLDALTAAADAGAKCPTQDELAELIGVEAVSTTVGIVNRLERKGLIKVERYQRERRVMIVATGNMTAPAANPVTHWRRRALKVPSPTLGHIRHRKPDVAAQIIVAARREGMEVQEFLACLVWAGFERYQTQQSGTG